MTENEAILIMDSVTRDEYLYMHDAEDRPYLIARAENIALNALKEIQQYRAIGTVEELMALKEYCIEPSSLRVYLTQLEKYHAIGTVEELKVLKEKNEPKELAEHNFQDEVHYYMCPSCRNIVSCNQNYCEECGQALET